MFDNQNLEGQYLSPVVVNSMSAFGLTSAGMHEAAKHYLLSRIDLDKHNATKAIDHYWDQQQNGSAPNASIPLAGRAPDLVALGKKFIADFSIVKKSAFDPRRGRFVHFVRDKRLNRHVHVSEDVLKQMFYDFVFDNIDDLAWDDESAMRRAFRRMLHAIPLLSETHMTVLEPTKIVALDSVFDLKTGTLIPEIQYPQGLFNTSSIPIKLLSGTYEHPAFDAVLTDCFDVDAILKQRAKELIGKLLSPMKSKSSIIVFQGVGNAGKTRLARLVVRHILHGAGVFIGNDFSDLGDDALKIADNSYSLVFIRDSVDKAISPKQRSYLKSYGDAGYDDGEPTYQLLICTNNELYTGDNGFVEKPLLNRCVVLSFPKAMDSTNPLVEHFEELHMESELPSIVMSCLKAYSEVLQRGGQFSGSCELNAVVEPNGEAAPQEAPMPDSKVTLEQLLDRCFELCDEADPAMTSTAILEHLQSLDPTLQASPETMGRVVRDHFGAPLVPKRLSAGMCYNLRRR